MVLGQRSAKTESQVIIAFSTCKGAHETLIKLPFSIHTRNQGRRNGGALRGHSPSCPLKGEKRGHRCPYIPIS